MKIGCNKNSFKSILKSNCMIISITIGIIVGFLIGLVLKLTSHDGDSELSLWFKLPGQLFLRSLQLLILPVIFFGVVTATSSFNIKSNARLSVTCLIITITSNILSCLIGVLGSLAFNRMNSIGKNAKKKEDLLEKTINMDRTIYDIVSDLLRNMLPTNVFKATLYQELTQYTAINETLSVKPKRRIIEMQNTNILGILVFAILIGVAAGVIKETGEAFRQFIQSANQVVITVLRWLVSLAPLGISSLIIDAVLEIKDFQQTFKEVWIFAAIVASCCLFYSLVFQALALFLVTRRNPFIYLPKLIDPLILAFASTSGAVCMHRSMEVCEQKLNISPAVSRFSIPFFTTLKSDGSIIFITVSTIFLAKFNSYTLVFSDYVLIIVMTCTICLSSPPGMLTNVLLTLLNHFFFSSKCKSCYNFSSFKIN